MDEFHSIDLAIYERHERDRLERMALNKAGMLELEALLNNRDSEFQQFDPSKRYSELKSQVCPKLWLLLSELVRLLRHAEHYEPKERVQVQGLCDQLGNIFRSIAKGIRDGSWRGHLGGELAGASG